MKFAHIADSHLGGWREEKLRDLNIRVFEETVNKCIENKVSFILISGDLFNTAVPSIDILKDATSILMKAKRNNIPVYLIPGSHDFSPSGKTMLDVLEKAGLFKNVVEFKDNKLQFTIDKSGIKITGLFGKKGNLERVEYETLDKEHLEMEDGFKVFMFHTALDEFKPAELEKMESLPLSMLPRNFNYYAGGHLHNRIEKKNKGSLIIFPGALFPNNFKELEEFGYGGFYIIDENLDYEYIPIKLKDIVSLKIDADDKTPEEIVSMINPQDFSDKIITIRIEGTLKSGKPSDINFKDMFLKLESAYCILKNTSKLSSKEFEIEKQDGDVEHAEERLLEKYLKDESRRDMAKKLMDILNKEKNEGERNIDFENRLVKDFISALDLKNIFENGTKEN